MDTENKEKLPLWLIVLNAFLIIAIIWLFFLIYGNIKSSNVVEAEQIKEVVVSPFFENIDIEAKSAYVLDIKNNKVLYSKNESSQLPLASITKLMTAVVALDIVPGNSTVTIKPEFLYEYGDEGLLPEENWKLKDLLDFSLITSSNDGSRAIASVIGSGLIDASDYNLGRREFIDRMNQKAKDLGFPNMYFINETGLDVSSYQAGAYGTSEEVALLLGYIIKNRPEIVELTKYDQKIISSETTTHNINNTNNRIGNISNVIVSKTGYTNLAGGNLAIIFDVEIGRPIAIVVLGSSLNGRFDDVYKLAETTFNYIRSI